MKNCWNPSSMSAATGACTRHYHPTLSIWLSVDPLSDKYPGVSPYAYCGNNPARLVDPNGEWSKSVHHKMIKTAVNELVRDGYVSKKDAEAMIKGMQKGSNKADGLLMGKAIIQLQYLNIYINHKHKPCKRH